MPNNRPKLRAIQPHPAVAQGQRFLVLQDPLQLAQGAVLLPQSIAPLLFFCDGTRTLPELRASLMIRAGIQVSLDDLEKIIAQLDNAFLLDNPRSAAAKQEALQAYRAAPFRPPNLAGHGYPAEPEELKALLDGYLETVTPNHQDETQAWHGLISPHIDYQRGGPVYAQVWKRAAEAAQAAEVVVILGTDHNGDYGRLTLTRQHYATPYGVLPTNIGMVDALAGAIGAQAAFEEELHHRTEHSIELAAVWLHHMRGGEPCQLVPILTGSFYHFVDGDGGDPSEDPMFARAVKTLSDALADKRTLIVAAADLAHIGPAFDGPAVDTAGRAQLQSQDEELLQTICAGEAERFFQTIQAERDQRNICGLPPIYLTLRLLGTSRGFMAGYDRCPADINNTSFVSICGVVLA